jgi:hypothetical protein
MATIPTPELGNRLEVQFKLASEPLHTSARLRTIENVLSDAGDRARKHTMQRSIAP